MKKVVLVLLLVFLLVSCVTTKSPSPQEKYASLIEKYIGECELFIKEGGYIHIYQTSEYPGLAVQQYIYKFREDFQSIRGYYMNATYYYSPAVANEMISIYQQNEERIARAYNSTEESLAVYQLYVSGLQYDGK